MNHPASITWEFVFVVQHNHGYDIAIDSMVQEVEGLFDLCDIDNDGTLTVDELKVFLTALDFSESSLGDLKDLLSKGSQGRVSKTEFVQFPNPSKNCLKLSWFS